MPVVPRNSRALVPVINLKWSQPSIRPQSLPLAGARVPPGQSHPIISRAAFGPLGKRRVRRPPYATTVPTGVARRHILVRSRCVMRAGNGDTESDGIRVKGTVRQLRV